MEKNTNDAIIRPAIRGKMGIWVYYVTTLTFKEIQSRVIANVAEELHKSTLLRTLIQRNLDQHNDSIVKYLVEQNERFFNALILAVYNGSPSWREIRVRDINGLNNYDMGILKLEGETIFPVDGQHRVNGIIEALKEHPELGDEDVPVIFIAHSESQEGIQRTRRLFSTLNRYAKPVSMRDIIALDEDDAAAIVSRNIIDEQIVFTAEGIYDSTSLAIPEANKKAITNIITFYKCNKSILWLLVKDITVKGLDERPVTGKTKITEYIRKRPDDANLAELNELCVEYWKSILERCETGNPDGIKRYRGPEGGHVFYRPVALMPFTEAVVRIREKNNDSFDKIINRFPEDVLWVEHKMWERIIWEGSADNKKMLTGNSALIKLMFLYVYDPNMLTNKERTSLKNKLTDKWGEELPEGKSAIEVLDNYIINH